MKPLLLIAGILVVRGLIAILASRRAGPRETKVVRSRTATMVLLGAAWLVVLPSLCWFALTQPRTLMTGIPLGILVGTFVMWPLSRYVLAPLGLTRAAYYVSLVAWSVAGDRSGMAILTASIALHRKRDFDSDAAAWLEEKIHGQSPLLGAAIAASGAIAAARGDREGARAIFQSIASLDNRVCTGAARHTAAEWLAADAASRGEWEEVIEIGHDFASAGRAAWLLANAAKRLLGKPGAPRRTKLLIAWLLAPRRRHTFAIVERALSVPDGAEPLSDDDDVRVPSAPEGDLLAAALAEHVALLSMKKPTAADLVRVGRAFDRAFDEGRLDEQVSERGGLLGAMRSGSALMSFREDVCESLFQVQKAHRIALDDTVHELGFVAGAAQRRLRDETLAVIEALSDAIRARSDERRALLPLDEWREVSALRMAYERGVMLGGPETRYLAFTKVHSDLCSLAVWLFNVRKEKAIANAVFRFLLKEAEAVGDERAIDLQKKNVDCGV